MRILELCGTFYNHLLVIEENKVTWFRRNPTTWDNWTFVCVIEHQNAINVIDDFYDINDDTFDDFYDFNDYTFDTDYDGVEILTIDGVEYTNKGEKWEY
jgi:hypothetical protein